MPFGLRDVILVRSHNSYIFSKTKLLVKVSLQFYNFSLGFFNWNYLLLLYVLYFKYFRVITTVIFKSRIAAFS